MFLVPMASMSPVHEYVQEGACQNQQPREYTEHMHPMLKKQERTRDREKSEHRSARAQEPALGRLLFVRTVLMRHLGLRFENPPA
jgi:phosphopantetheinyl transferase